jgi:hypothetical protein
MAGTSPAMTSCFCGTNPPFARFRCMRIKPALLLSCVLLAMPAVAFAQAPPTRATPAQQTAPPPPHGSANCAPMSPDGTNSTEHSTVGRAGGGELGDKLAQSDGVLCPPSNIDPAMRAPAPETGKMPVIPPPGSPGGDPSVRPK